MSGVKTISPFDRILYLKSVPAVGELSSPQVARLAAEAEEVHFEAGQALLTPGRINRAFFVIASGTVKVKRGEGQEQTISNPDTLGFVDMLAEDSGTSAVAASDVVALRFRAGPILEVLEEDFELLQNTIRSLARAHLVVLRRVIGGTRRAPWKQLVAVGPDRELDLLEKLIMIRQGDLFEAIGLEAGVLVATSMKQVAWTAGTVLWKPGEPSGSMYMIIDGEVEAELENGDRFEAGIGYPLGNIESQADLPRWYQATARTDVVAFRTDQDSFFDVMEDDFEVAEAFLKAMSFGILGAQDTLAARGEPTAITTDDLTAD